VIVPIYQSSLNAYEQIALHQCLKVLHRYPIIFVAPDGLMLDGVDTQGASLTIQRFPPEYFSGIDGYNRLMMSQEFYRRFLDYRYILIHQLDVFVFADTLTDWCAAGYDYIGAPWTGRDFVEDCRASLPAWIRNRRLRRLFASGRFSVGNGGLSLRNVRSFLLMLSMLKGKAATWPFHEDIFWGILVPGYNPFFRIPSVDHAQEFAIELSPRESVEKNGGRLPFGCHAWEKYDPEFWRGVIRQYGYSV
jgi:hypothetical protein